MRNPQLKIVVLLALIALQFSSCENEPLEGQFTIEQEDIGNAASGEFRARVDGVNFIADQIEATYIVDSNSLIISGAISTTGQKIEMGVEGVGQGAYPLAYTGTTEDRGVYWDPTDIERPYLTYILVGGSGTMRVTDIDTALEVVSGSFDFIAFREILDDAGNVVLDGAGNPTYEEIQIGSGTFKDISYTVIETNDGGGGDTGDPTDPDDSFTAKVDGIDFVANTISVIEAEVGGIPMLNVVATNAAGAKIRIDIPKSTGVGTFPFETEISDGTDLIALYNAGDGGENLTANPGVITITEFGQSTGKLAASFQFTGTDPLGIDGTVVQVTEGSFAVDYIENTGAVSNEFAAEIDGVLYEPTMIDVIQSEFNGTNVVSVNATDTANNRYIQLNFPEGLAIGSYAMSTQQINGDEVVGLYVPDIGVSGNFNSTSGSLNITSYDAVNKIYEATFSFTAEDLTGNDSTIYGIANGSFVIQLQ